MAPPHFAEKSESTTLSQQQQQQQQQLERQHPSLSEPQQKFSTAAIHVGSEPDPYTGAVIPPLTLSSTFKQRDVGQLYPAAHEYSRAGNPNRQALEACVAALEQGKYGLAFSSGSAALTTVMHGFSQGTKGSEKKHVVCINDVYGGTYRFLTKVAPALGWEVSFVEMSKADSWNTAVRPGETRVVWVESPTNPTLRMADIKSIAEKAHAAGCYLVVDNTFLSPYFQQPLTLGADVVIHSGTKYLNGHGDVVIGMAITNNAELYEKIKFMQNAVGAVPSPFDCYLTQRGLKTLALRMRQHGENALKVARYLESNWRCARVIYPGLESHPQHELAKRQHLHGGHGGMVTMRIYGDDVESARKFVRNLKLFTLAESLGGVESLCEIPSLMTHASVDPVQRRELGITDGLVRLSVGIEDADDLIADLSQALEYAIPAKAKSL